MSLINDMLKNLERREGVKQSKWNWGINNLHEEYEEKSPLVQAIIITIVTCIIIAAIIFGIFEWHKHHGSKNLNNAVAAIPAGAPAPAIPATAAPAIPAAAPQTIQPAQGATAPATNNPNGPLPPPPSLLSGLSVNDLGNQLQVDLAFSGNTPTYTANFDKTTNTLKLTLQHLYLETNNFCQNIGKAANCTANNTIPLPINTTVIQTISIDQNDGQALALSFHLSPGASYNNATLISPPNKPGLVLTFNKQGGDNATITPNSPSQSASPLNTMLNGPTDDVPENSDMILQPVVEKNTIDKNAFDKIQNLIDLQKYSQAKAILQKMSTTQRNSVGGVMARAKLLLAEGNQAGALDLLQNYKGQNPPADFYALFAATLEFNGQHERAMEIYQNLVNYWPKNPTWWLGLGISALNSNNSVTAAEAFQHVLAFPNISADVNSYVHLQLANLRTEN